MSNHLVSLEMEDLADLYGRSSKAEQYIADLELCLRQALREEDAYERGERVPGAWIEEARNLLGENT